MKRLISVLLIFTTMLSLGTPVFAESGRVTTNYYSIDMELTLLDNTVITDKVDVMIYPSKEEIYINAEDLAGLSIGYTFKLSEKDCAYYDKERDHLVYYKFNAEKMLVYYSDQPLSYTMPYTVKYVDGVVWIPLDFGMKMLNMNYVINENGASCCAPYNTVLSVANRILKGNYAFDYGKDLGYSDLSMFGLETGAFLTNLFNGVVGFEGSCWGTLFTSIFGNKDLYDKMMAEKVCALFVSAAENEVAKTVSGLYQIPVTTLEMEDALQEGFNLYYDARLSESNKKLLKNAEKISDKAKQLSNGKKLSSIADSVDWADTVGTLIDIAATTLQFENRDAVAARALKYYGEASNSNVANTVSKFAKDMQISNKTARGLSRYITENWDNLLLGTIQLGPSALLTVGWSIVSATFPNISNALESTESFSCAQQAAAMQNDAYGILKDDYYDALSSKKLREASLEHVGVGCYTYLKFSLIARECAIASIKNSKEIDETTKKNAMSRLESRNNDVAEMLSVVSCVEEGEKKKVNNNNGVYGLLIPSECSAYRKALDDKPAIDAVKNSIGTLIGSSSQEAEPEPTVLLTEEEAIEMVRKAMNKYSMGLMDSSPLASVYSFKCIDRCNAYVIDLEAEGIMDDTAEFEKEYCYIIALLVNNSVNGLFCVPTDGTGAYLCSPYGDLGYGFLQEFNLNNLSVSDIAEVMKKFGNLVLGEMVSEYATSEGASSY